MKRAASCGVKSVWRKGAIAQLKMKNYLLPLDPESNSRRHFWSSIWPGTCAHAYPIFSAPTAEKAEPLFATGI